MAGDMQGWAGMKWIIETIELGGETFILCLVFIVLSPALLMGLIMGLMARGVQRLGQVLRTGVKPT